MTKTFKLVLFIIFINSCTTSAVALPSGSSYRQPPQSFSRTDNLSTVAGDSFSHRDHNGVLAISHYNQHNPEGKKLKQYQGLHNFDVPPKTGDALLPWRNGPFVIDGQKVLKLNLNKYDHAKYFADLVLAYILEGWFTTADGHKITDKDEHFRDNSYRTWCTTPGVVDGAGGREAVHGLTKELGLKPNPIFPARQGIDHFNEELWQAKNSSKRPAGWGQPFFNAVVCEQYGKIFGRKSNTRLPIMHNQDLLTNRAGFVSFKLHFNAMAEWSNYRPFRGAYTWLAHVGNTRGQRKRALQDIPLIQISVSMKLDPKYIDGLTYGDGSKKADDWVMLAFYHDAQFTRSAQIVGHVPPELSHMRPMGIQTGFAPADTLMFQGAKSNYKVNRVNTHGDVIGAIWHENDSQTLLNGPADNAYSSCMGCHAGFSYMHVLQAKDPRRGRADGLSFYDVETFKRTRTRYGKGVDFNLQLFNAFNKVEAWLEKVYPVTTH